MLDELLAQGPKLVAVAHVSNVLGTINPIAEIVARAHAAGALVLVDGAQAVPSMPVDVAELGADFYAWTGHKAYGPTGIGVLHGRRELLRGDAAVPRRRAHDRPRRRVRVHLGRAAREVRGGHDADRRGDRPRRRGRLAHRDRHGRRARARPRRHRLCARAAVRGRRAHDPRHAATSMQRGSLVSFALEGIHPHDVAEILGRERRLRARRPPLRAAADAPPRLTRPRRARRSRSTTRARTSTR